MEKHNFLTIGNIVLWVAIALLPGQSYARPTSTDEIEDMKKALYSVCSKKFEISEEMKIEAKNSRFPDNRTFKCFSMCILEELSLIDEEGVIDGETLIAMSPEELKSVVEASVKQCLPDIAGKPDSCEVAYNFLTCGVKMNKKLTEFLPF